LTHNLIDSFRGKGLFIAVEMKKNVDMDKFFDICFAKGIIYDFFLFSKTAFRIAPPLTITNDEIIKISEMLLESMNEYSNEYL